MRAARFKKRQLGIVDVENIARTMVSPVLSYRDLFEISLPIQGILTYMYTYEYSHTCM